MGIRCRTALASYTLDLVDNGFADNTQIYTVPPGHYFMMRDNATIPPTAGSARSAWCRLRTSWASAIIFFSVCEGERAWQFWRWPLSVRWSRLFTIVK